MPGEKCLVLIYRLKGMEFEKSLKWQDVYLVCVCVLNLSPRIELNAIKVFDNGKLGTYPCVCVCS